MAIFKKQSGQLVDFSNPVPSTSIAPIEDGATSTHNYVVGAYALVKGILKKVTSAISSGTAFSDSNSETTDVATELKELNDDVTTINTHLSELEGAVDLPFITPVAGFNAVCTVRNGIVELVGTTPNGSSRTLAVVQQSVKPLGVNVQCQVSVPGSTDISKNPQVYVNSTNGQIELVVNGSLTYGVYFRAMWMIHPT